MDIKINSIALHNFKGVRGDRVFRFDGRSARIEGDNGTGKSTVFDAFTWLLFGKDHLGQDWTHFDIKPIDPATGATIADLDYTAVEAELSVNGARKTLRRVITEDWVKPRGEAERVLKGHSQTFFVDGVACETKKAYDATIHSLIAEDVFRVVTNPHQLIDPAYTDWKVRRRAILAAVGYDPAAVAQSFADLVAEMNGRPVEEFRRMVTAQKKAQRDALADANSRIAAWQSALPEEVNEDEVNAAIDGINQRGIEKAGAVKERIIGIDSGIADVNARNAEADKAAGEKNARVRALRLKMQDYIGDAINAARKARSDRKNAILGAEGELNNARAQKRGLQANLESYRLGLAEDSARLKRLGEEYEKERASAFEPGGEQVCPVCGRPLDEAKLREEWLAAKRDALRKIQEQVPPLRGEIAAWKESIDKAEQHLGAVEDNIVRLTAELEQAQSRPQTSDEDAETAARKSEDYQAMAEMLTALEAEAKEAAAGTASAGDLLEQRRALEAELETIRAQVEADTAPLRDALAVARERKRIQGLIDDAEQRRRGYADELARLERLEVRTLEYIKASIDACEDAINARFKECRWKMFDRTLDGGLVEMCEVTTREGVPYASMNSAARIICGMEVIRVLGEANGVAAPIFVDNAESVTRTDFIPGAQVIRLVVREGAALTVIPE